MSQLYLYRGDHEGGYALEEAFPSFASIKEYVRFYPEADSWLVKISVNGRVLNAAYADRAPGKTLLFWREYAPLREHYSP
jgi:hypothetical protein